MRLSHTAPVAAARFDEPNLVSAAGVVPVMRLAAAAGLGDLAGRLVTVADRQGRERGREGHGAGLPGWSPALTRSTTWRCCGTARWARLFDRTYAPSTLGSFLREFRFGHVRQLDAVAARFLAALAARTDLLPGGGDRRVWCSSTSTTRLSRSTATPSRAPVRLHRGPRAEHAARHRQHAGGGAGLVAQRLRKGSCGSPRGAKRLVADALKTVRSLRAGRGRRAGAGASGLRLLRPARPSARRSAPAPGVGHRPDDSEHQGGDRRHRRGHLDRIEYTDAILDE